LDEGCKGRLDVADVADIEDEKLLPDRKRRGPSFDYLVSARKHRRRHLVGFANAGFAFIGGLSLPFTLEEARP
jgi:hypothetical protein